MSTTKYSDIFDGDRGNFKWPARFDLTTGGYLGVTQTEEGKVKDRVLLSPKQVKELLAFLAANNRR